MHVHEYKDKATWDNFFLQKKLHSGGLPTHASHILGILLYQLSYRGSSAGRVQITHTNLDNMYIHVCPTYHATTLQEIQSPHPSLKTSSQKQGQAPCITTSGQDTPTKTAMRQEPPLAPAAPKSTCTYMYIAKSIPHYNTRLDACIIPSSVFVWQVLVCRTVVTTALSVIP